MADPELDKFLNSVDEVNSVIQGLASGDTEAANKADKLLKKKDRDANLGFNASRINKIEDEPVKHEQSKEDWMQAMAADAEQRAASRKKRQNESDDLKQKGNQYFAQGEYQKAIEVYTQAAEIMKDNLPVFTNRAQAYIKLGELEKAIEDCDWAFRIDENCLKAFIHKSRALALSGRIADARSCLDEALDKNPQSKKTITQYMYVVDEIEKSAEQEKIAGEEKETESMSYQSIRSILEGLQRKDQPILFYIGGMDCMQTLIKTEADKTLFRMEGGFDTISKIPFFVKFLSDEKQVESKTDKSAVITFLKLVHYLIDGCHENVKHIFDSHDLIYKFTVSLFDSGHSKDLRNAAISILKCLLEHKLSRGLLVDFLDWSQIVSQTVRLLELKAKLTPQDLELISLLLEEKVYCQQLAVNEFFVKNITRFCLDFKTQENSGLCKNFLLLLDKCLKNPSLTKLICNSSDLLNAVTKLFDVFGQKNEEILAIVLGLLCNIGATDAQNILENAEQILLALKPLLDSRDASAFDDRLYRLLGVIAQKPSVKLEMIKIENIIEKAVSYFKSYPEKDETCKHASKLLAILTSNSAARAIYWVNDKNLKTTLLFLEKSESNAICCGNAALILSNFFSEKEYCEKVTDEGVCKLLLSVTSNNPNESVRSNCGIALSRLVSNNKQHIVTLRKLDGLKILHDCMKFIN